MSAGRRAGAGEGLAGCGGGCCCSGRSEAPRPRPPPARGGAGLRGERGARVRPRAPARGRESGRDRPGRPDSWGPAKLGARGGGAEKLPARPGEELGSPPPSAARPTVPHRWCARRRARPAGGLVPPRAGVPDPAAHRLRPMREGAGWRGRGFGSLRGAGHGVQTVRAQPHPAGTTKNLHYPPWPSHDFWCCSTPSSRHPSLQGAGAQTPDLSKAALHSGHTWALQRVPGRPSPASSLRECCGATSAGGDSGGLAPPPP